MTFRATLQLAGSAFRTGGSGHGLEEIVGHIDVTGRRRSNTTPRAGATT